MSNSPSNSFSSSSSNVNNNLNNNSESSNSSPTTDDIYNDSYNIINQTNNNNNESPSTDNSSSSSDLSSFSFNMIPIPVQNPFDCLHNLDTTTTNQIFNGKNSTRKLIIPKILNDDNNNKNIIIYIPHKMNTNNYPPHYLKSQLIKYIRSKSNNVDPPSIANSNINATLIKPKNFPYHYKIKLTFPNTLLSYYNSFTNFLTQYKINYELNYLPFNTFKLGPIANDTNEEKLIKDFKQYININSDIAFIYDRYGIFGHSAKEWLKESSNQS